VASNICLAYRRPLARSGVGISGEVALFVVHVDAAE
jgi:hypothetical protein